MSQYDTYKKLFKYQKLISFVRDSRLNNLQNFQNEGENLSNSQIYEKVYKILFDNHKFEYIFKNEFLNLHINEVYDQRKKLLYEVEIYKDNTLINILDLLLITESSAYAIEIKSDFDTPNRLEKQLDTYMKLFQYVSIFVSEEKLSLYLKHLEDMRYETVGVLSLVNGAIRTIKKPLQNELDIEMIKENIWRLKPGLPIEELPIDKLYTSWLNILFTTFSYDSDFVRKMPRSLKFFSYSHSNMQKLRKARLLKFFK